MLVHDVKFFNAVFLSSATELLMNTETLAYGGLYVVPFRIIDFLKTLMVFIVEFCLTNVHSSDE